MDFQKDCTYTFVSRRNSGKSHLARFLLYNLLDMDMVDEVFIFSQTEYVSKSFDCLPKSHVFNGWMPNIVVKIMKTQEKEVIKLGREKAHRVLLILDDVIGSLSPTDQIIQKLYTLGRHFNMTIVTLLQYSKGVLSPTLRCNSDYLFLGRLSTQALGVLYETCHYDGNLPQFIKFVQKQQSLGPYTFLLYDSLTSIDAKRWKQVTAPEERISFQVVFSKKVKSSNTKN